MGPPIAIDPCRSESGMSGGTIVRVDENDFACHDPGRPRKRASPCKAFVPDFVTTFTAVLDVQPNSAEKARDMTFISCTAPTGIVENIVCLPHGSSPVAPSTT